MPEGAVVIADPNLIFNGEFKRTGVDLVLSHDGHEFVVHDYFRGDKRAAIASPDGAHLTGDIVSALTGYVQVAQAAPGAAAAQVIGHVTKLAGSATAVRNGVSVILNNGDNVEKGDVVSTGSDSTLGVTFIDGTVFGLSSNARMVLNEMVYDPNGSNNSSLLSLVAGTITFVAGETAKHGDMKIDTPVATMGIRGTAVLTEINFVVPSGGGDPQPQANFQVLVEPNGTTGSYILFDKLTLLPIATVNQAGQMIQISGGNVSITNGLLSPDVQKLITDVFTLKFTDNNTNTKLTTNFTDTITQSGNLVFAKTDTGAIATATLTNTVNTGNGSGQGGADKGGDRIPGKPLVASLDQNGNPKTAFSLTERAGHTDDTADLDTVGGFFTFLDLNIGDRPTGQITFTSFTYQNAGQQDVTAGLSDLQKADIAATEIVITAVPDALNANNGSVHWTYSIPDHAFDFLAAGETLTLTYTIRVDNNFTVNNEFATQTFTITITGTNDQPVITSSVPTITFAGGTSVPGGPLATKVPTSGALTFTDVDLTDTHTVSVSKFSAVLPGGTVPQSIYNFLANDLSVSIASGHDSTGSGTGTINWSLGDIPVYLADFIPKGQVLTLTYTVTVTDSQGATSDQTITVTITGTDAPAVVWIATNAPGAPSGGFWKDGANWETGNAPTISDDVIVITDQLHGLTPSYPVTIDAAAFANSLTMNDFDIIAGHKAPEVINKSSLTIAQTLTLGADSKLTNLAAGSISVGGKAEFSGTSVLTNAGYLTLDGGGDFASGTSITNSGTIELFGGTLATLTEIHNAGGTLKVDGGAKLIVNAATVDGGTVTILGTLELDGTSLIENGTLSNFGSANVKGAVEFAKEIVYNNAGGMIEVFADDALTIDQGSRVNNSGNVKVDASSKLTINGAMIDGGAIVVLPGTPVIERGESDTSGSTFTFVLPSVGTITNNGELDLTGNAVLSNGILKNNSTLNVTGTGNALDGEAITNTSAGTIEVLANGALTLDQGSVVTNTGNVTVDATGKLTVNGASISGAGTVTDNGEIDLTGNAVLSGGTLKNNVAFKVSGTGNALDNETVTNASAGTIEVLANGALTIDQGSVVTNTGNVTVDATGKLTVNGATITGAGTVTDNGEIDLTGNAVLSGGILKNNAAFKISGTGNALDNETVTNASAGTIEVLANGGLTIDQGSVVTNTGNVTVDATGKLTVNGASITGAGTVTDNGEIDLTGNAVLSGGTLKNNAAFKISGTGNALDGEAITNTSTGTIELLANGALTIDQGSVVTNTGNVTVDATGKLTVNGASISGAGTVTDNGEIDLTGNAVLSGGTLKNNVAFKVSGTGNALDNETVTNASAGTIEVLANGALTIDQGSVVTNTGNVTVDTTGKLTADGATITGAGTVTDNGEIDLTGSAVLSGGILKNNAAFKISGTGNALDNETVTNASAGTIEVLANGALTIDQGSVVTNTGNVTVDATSKLTVNGATITGAGTVTDNGEIDLTGSAVLSGGILKNNAAFKISGTGNALDNEAITNAGTIEVLTNGALAMDQGSTVANSSGNVIIDAHAALTLNGAAISGGAVKGAGTIDVTGASKIDSGATLSVATVTADAKLTLDGVTVSGSTITDNSSIELDNIVKLKDSAKIQGASAAAKGAITNAGTLEIAGAATLLNDALTNTGHVIQVDDGQTLTLSGTEITGGTINNYNGALGGTIDVTGDVTIDGNATLNKGAVTVESGFTLTLDDATVSGTAITNGGAVKVDASKKLTLAGASLTGGTLTVAGTLDSSGSTTITDTNILNSYLIEALGGVLALVATTSATAITNDGGTIQANGGELDINGEAVTNTGKLTAINDGTLKLNGMTVANTGGTVSVELGSTLDLNGAIIDGGTVTIAGTLESTGTSALNNGDITNTGTITVTGGTLTIDPAVLHTITNHKLIQASGAELDISYDLIVNTADIKALNGGILKLTTLTVTNDGGTVTVDGTSKLYLSGVSINGGSLSNSGNLYGVSGSNTISAGVTNTGTIEVQAGTLNLSGGLTGAGSLVIDDRATLELAGATAQTVTFAGGTDTLQLDKVAGQSFTGTIAGQSSKGGTFTVTGAADITTSSGDALDFTATGGTLAKPAGIVLTPTGALKGAANGVVVTQNGIGAISLTATKDITGLAGNGITLRDSATGAGAITVNDLTGKATGTGANSVGVLVENLNAANAGDISITQLGGAVGGAYGIDAQTRGDGDITIDAGGTITGSSIYGIRARSYGAGSETVTTEAGSVVTSGSSGIVAVNRAISLDANDSTIIVNAHGTINSGSSLNQSGNPPAGIQAGYNGATTGAAVNTDVNGSVIINNYANVTASGGYGIHAYNYGNGDVTVNDGAGTTVVGASQGIRAQALSGGSGDVSVTLGTNASVTGTAGYGIFAYSVDQGDVSVTMAAGDSIAAGSSGIVAINYATAIASGVSSTITVKAHGTINSGATLNDNNTTPGGIIAGYNPNGGYTPSNQVYGDVTVESDAIITANGGYGIEAFNWGIGDVTVTTGVGSSITSTYAAIGAFNQGGGDVSVTNEGSATGSVGLSAVAVGTGNITVTNDGSLTGTSLAGLSVIQDATGATGSSHVSNTNTGTVVGASGAAAIYIQENTHGTAVIDNSGTIGPDAASVTSTTYAIVETGGAITINNSGHINGNISVASATFDNEAGGTWTVSGTSVFGALSTLDNAGEIDLHSGASISGGTGFAIGNSSDIESWGTTSISGIITNTGEIEVHTGTLTLFGSLSGSGSVAIDAGATLEVNATVSQTITFSGGGAELQIDTSNFGGSVTGFAATDKLDLSTIKFDGGTSATYDAATGDLVVSDAYGHNITVKLTGADYSDANFAGSSDGHGGTLITYNAADDKPTFAAAETSQSAAVTEQPALTGATTTMDQSTPTGGTIHFTDIDLTDRPTATITDHVVTGLAADGTTPLALTPDEVAALENALSLQQTGKNNGTVSWTYSIADSALDFLGENQTVKVVSTITLDDGHKTDTAQVTITITGANDAPVITTGTNDTASATLAETNAGLTKSGTLTVSDADATDHVTASATNVGIYLDGHLQTDGIDGLTNADLLNYLTVQSGDILNGTATHTQFSWDFNSGGQAFDFLAAGQTLSLQYTIVPNDGHATGTGEVITITIAGSNDAPTLDSTMLASVAGNQSNPAGDTVSHLFADKFHDVDDGASFHAIAVTSDAATATEGVWQYEVAGTSQWVDIGPVSDTNALVLGTDALIRFVPADGFTGAPDPLGVHALDNTYTGAITTSASTATTDITAMSTDGTAPVSGQAATISTSVTAPARGPVIDTSHLLVSHDGEANTDTITDLSVIDTDPGASTDTFTVAASTSPVPSTDASSVDVPTTSGSLNAINLGFANGVTYTPGDPAPDQDRITLTVTDKTTGLSDTVNFIFNEGDASHGVTLNGTSGKDVIFATTTGDKLSGGGGKDQFVFAPGSAGYDDEGHPVADYAHTITDFIEGVDRIDLRQFSGVSSIGNLSITQQNGNTLVAWQQQIGTGDSSVTEHEQLLLKNVTAALKASDFIFHIT
ncbi:VCBS domain-containing protein [Bradyrhizobium sp. AZCC 2230]|uniref:VCBS domain-containing protein n=1 Tax=Bradyrhizobium sp. AZCC 2230 TaxID=3117021 RepID=UPI002FEF0084